jgi:heptosyltransferase-1
LLVVRLGAMGDLLHALPAVTALRRAHPTWTIDWAVEPRWRALLTAEDENAASGAARDAARPLVDQVYLVPAKDWSRDLFGSGTWAGIGKLKSKLRAAEYDAVIDLQGAVRSALVARMTGSKRIVGEARPREMAAKWFFTERVKTAGEHMIEQDLEVASAIAGDALQFTRPALPVDLDAEEWCDRHEELKSAIWMGKPVVLLHPGGGWGAKRWPADRYGAVAEEFAVRGGVVLVNAAPGEEALAEAVVAKSGGQAIAVQCTIGQLIALTRRVSMVIGGDTGPLHLACALGKPVVGIYGPTDPKRNGPFGSRFRVLRNPESRQDHTRRDEPEAGLLTITPDMVMHAVGDLLKEERNARKSREQASGGRYGDSEAGWNEDRPIWADGGEMILEAQREPGRKPIQGQVWEAKRP